MTPLDEYDYKGYRVELFLEDTPDLDLGVDVYGFNIFKAGDFEDIIRSGTGYWEMRYTLLTAYMYVDRLYPNTGDESNVGN